MISIDDIRAETIRLRELYVAHVATTDLKSNVLATYATKISTGIIDILNGPPESIVSSLEAILRTNWELVAGTFLCPTE